MKRNLRSQGFGFVAGTIVAISLVTAFGAGYGDAPVTPRYSVDHLGAALLVVDNQTNQMYVYANGAKGSKLRSTLDLNDTGKRLMKGQLVDETTDGEDVDLSKLTPDANLEITAKIRAKVSKLTEDSVQLQVTSLGETEKGVPMLSKIPHQERLFKSVGAVRTETPAIIEIAKNRIQGIEELKPGSTNPASID